MGSVVMECGVSSCTLGLQSTDLALMVHRFKLLCSMWNIPGPGIELTSPTLVGGFLTTGPPGKSRRRLLWRKGSWELQ